MSSHEMVWNRRWETREQGCFFILLNEASVEGFAGLIIDTVSPGKCMTGSSKKDEGRQSFRFGVTRMATRSVEKGSR